jgi:hypothetical protein
MWLILSQVLLWVLVLALGFLLLGTLRALGLVRWRLEQLRKVARIPFAVCRGSALHSIRPGGLSPCHLFLVRFEGDFGIFARRTVQQGRFPSLQIFPKESFDIDFCDG